MSTSTLTRERAPFVPVGRSALRHPVVVILGLLLGLAIAGFLGLSRSPIYTSTAQLSVGRIDLGTPGAVAGFSVATQNLASAYSRAIDADAVVTPVAAKLHVTPDSLKKRLSASPIADSPVFIVEAKARSSRLAVRIANLASTSLNTYITDLNRSNPDSQRLFRDFQAAALAYSQLKTAETMAERAYERLDTRSNRRRLDRARARSEGALLRRETLRLAYQGSRQGQSRTSLIQTLSPARGASSDQASKLQIFLFAGLLGGAIVGLSLATFLANRRRPLAAIDD